VAAKAATGKVIAKLRALCLALPDTTEVEAWGHPTFRVGVGKSAKIFCACGEDEDGDASLGWKCEPDVQHALVASDPRFTIAAYVGKHGWVSFAATGKLDWGFIEAQVAESYRLVAKPKKAAKAAKATKTKATKAKAPRA
jgi:predicted DNA-binding protein (MmcQ/YjbR family)